jgi:hypothetical protein
VTCEGGTYPCLIILLPPQNPRSPGTSPLGLTSLKRNNLPIVVTLGGIGSCYDSLAFKPQSLTLATNCTITFWRHCRGTLNQTFLRRNFFSKPCSYSSYLTSLLGDTTSGIFPYLLIVSRKLSGESTDDEANYDFTMGSGELQTFGHE